MREQLKWSKLYLFFVFLLLSVPLLYLVFFSFNDKLDELCVACEGKISPNTEEKIIALIDSITEELILPKRERQAV